MVKLPMRIRFVITHILVWFVPLIVSIFFYFIAVNIIASETNTINQIALKQIRQGVDQKIG